MPRKMVVLVFLRAIRRNKNTQKRTDKKTMRHSQTTVSDLLNDIFACNQEIEETILIGERIAMISEAGHLYNQLKALTTPDYFFDGEFEWIRSIAKSWNREVIAYGKAQSGKLEPEQEMNLQELEDRIREALNDLMRDNPDTFDNDYPFGKGGFDGGDGIY